MRGSGKFREKMCIGWFNSSIPIKKSYPRLSIVKYGYFPPVNYIVPIEADGTSSAFFESEADFCQICTPGEYIELQRDIFAVRYGNDRQCPSGGAAPRSLSRRKRHFVTIRFRCFINFSLMGRSGTRANKHYFLRHNSVPIFF